MIKVKVNGGGGGGGSGDISGSGIANELAYFTAEKIIDNLPVGTYPNLAELSRVKGVTSPIQTQINSKVTANGAITGATKTKITYDAKGLVTSGEDATTADIADSLNKRYVTDAEKTVIGNTSNTNTGDETQSTILTKIGYTPENVTNKGAANGYVPLGADSKIASTYLPSYVDDVVEVNTYGDLPVTGETGKIYIVLIGTEANREYRWSGSVYVEIKDSGETTSSIGALINGATEKTTPVDADMIGLMDSAASNILKKLSWSNIKATLKSYFDTLYLFASNLRTSRQATPDDTHIPSEKLVKDSLDFKAPLASPTFTGTVTLPKTLEIQDTSTDHQYVLAVNELTADRTVTLPLLTGNDEFTFNAHIQTLTNKRINPKIVTATSYTTDTGTSLSVATCDIFVVTAQAGALKFNNPGGTPLNGQKLMIRVKDNGTARALTYDTQFRAIGVTLPTTTVISKTLYIGAVYNSDDTKRDVLAVGQEA